MARRSAQRTLHQAVRDQDTRAIERLLAEGIGVDERDEQGWTPLLLAALRGDVAVTALLLRAGADPNATLPGGDHGLSIAARGGFVEVIERLVEAGAHVAEHGGAALRRALVGDEDAVVQTLLDLGARGEHVDPELGDTLLETALSRKKDAWIGPLLAAGARPDGAGFTRPLMHAVLQGRIDLVETLLAAGADPGVRNDHGDTPMHTAAEEGNVPIAERLLQAGAALDPVETRARQTPLHQAARAGRTEMVAWLLENGVDRHRLDAEGRNALTLARMGLHEDTSAALVKAGVRDQPDHEEAIAAARREAEEERARREAEAAKLSAFTGRPGQVTKGAFSGMRGAARPSADGRLEAQVSVFGRTVVVTLDAAEFAFDEG